MRITDLTGQRFGFLTVLERTEEKEDKYYQWRCRCDCGGEIVANTKRLKRGTIKNCGCVERTSARRGPVAEDLTGQIFGNYTVLHRMESRNGRTRWMCRCKCGTEKVVLSRDLKSGGSRSCGCEQYKKGRYLLNIEGQRYGRLTALFPTSRRDKKSSVYWKCRCDCGTEVEVTVDRLMYGNYRSCGCLKKENQQAIFAKLHMVDGTCVEWLEKRKTRSDNTSGFRGVYRMKNGNYRVSIGFKGERFHVGTYRTYEEAVDARLEVEGLLHDGFVKAYYSWKQHAETDPLWVQSNPFVYEVERSSDGFIVHMGAGQPLLNFDVRASG